MDDPEVLAIVCALAGYVRANPLASDTAEGIYRWWLDPDKWSMDKVTRALTWMKEQGLLKEQVALDRRARYRRSANDEALQRMLDQCRDVLAARH